MILEAAHPAPVSFVPRRGRNARFAFATLRSPVEIPEDDLARSDAVGPLFPTKPGALAEPLRLLDGRLWSPVAARDAAGAFREAGLDEFVDWLAGRGAEDAKETFRRQFSGTPLVAYAKDERASAMVMSRGLETRGEEIDLDGVREMRLDGRDRSRVEVARYVSEEIRLLDGRPFMRCSPVLMASGVADSVTYRIESRIWPDHPGMRAYPATHETLDDALAVLAGFRVGPPEASQEPERARWAAIVPAGTLEGDDTRILLNAFAGPVCRSLDIALEAAGYRQSSERLQAARRSMAAVEVAAMTGTAHRDGSAPILAMREALAAWMARPRNGSHGQEYLAAFLDRIVIPRLDAQAAADIDVPSLLAP